MAVTRMRVLTMILGGGDDVDDVMPEVVVENEVPMQSWTPP